MANSNLRNSATRDSVAPIFSAVRIAELTTADGAQILSPTAEQQRVIEHPLDGTALVVAGAGSGKTETMANRVVWLVANGLVAADEVLGLTFTRKAAGELSERVQRRLNQFSERLADAAERGLLSEREMQRAHRLTEELDAGLALPEIATYDAFAGGIVQEFGLLAGVTPNLTLIDSAMAWGIARETVRRSEEPGLREVSLRLDAIVKQVLALDHAISDNQSDIERVDQVIAEFMRTAALPYNDREAAGVPSGKLYADIRDAIALLTQTRLITQLARAFADEKHRQGVIEFSDQLRLARFTAEHSAEAVALLRKRHRAVLLDEVQDTSVGQTRLLSTIFAGSSVMAVGDPHQSIYGWRGASADGMQTYHRDFQAPGAASQDTTTLSLSVSWRNPSAVLEAANTVSAPLREISAIDVTTLIPRPGADQGEVEWIYPDTLQQERDEVAQWLQQARYQHLQKVGTLPTTALVMRNRRHMAGFSAALTALDIPNHIIGVGGLLSTPEVTDLVSTLRCVWFADANSALIRLLSGPRFRIGVTDLAGLRDAARWFAARDISHKRLDEDDVADDGVLLDPDRRFTLLDTVDEIAGMRTLEHSALTGITELGRRRLREAGIMLRELRSQLGNGIPALIRATEHALRLDLELDAAEHRGFEGSAAARANLDAFSELVDGFLSIDEHGTLANVLSWLEQASIADETAEHAPEPLPGAVQIITAHGSKGLEWDLVVVPRMVDQEFPAPSKEGSGWLRSGQFPDELRGDAAARPHLNWRICTTQKDLKDVITSYKQALREHRAFEERRLAYVAITRARSRLLLSGSFWGGQSKARNPSPFLVELQEAGSITGLPEQSTLETDPSAETEQTLQWPLDPLGRRANAVLRAAEQVRSGLIETGNNTAIEAGIGMVTEVGSDAVATLEIPLDPVVKLLLAERNSATQRRELGVDTEPLADRLTASTFHEFVEDPEAAERRRRRPLPQRPYRRTRLGNLFHEWVERRSSTVRGTEIPLIGLESHVFAEEGFIGEGEFPETDASQLAVLIEQFERSRWAELMPLSVELEIAIPFAGRRLVCKLDAVYRTGSEDNARYEIVDWKSGRPPQTEQERQSRFLQLDLYRHAYAQWANVEPDRIDVSLFYVGQEQELRGQSQRSLSELEMLWHQSAAQLRPAAENE